MELSMQESRFDGITDNALLVMLNTGDPNEVIQARGEVRKRLGDRRFALDRIMKFAEDALLDTPSGQPAVYFSAIKKIANAVGIV